MRTPAQVAHIYLAMARTLLGSAAKRLPVASVQRGEHTTRKAPVLAEDQHPPLACLQVHGHQDEETQASAGGEARKLVTEGRVRLARNELRQW